MYRITKGKAFFLPLKRTEMFKLVVYCKVIVITIVTPLI
jgi:hypothetical protein